MNQLLQQLGFKQVECAWLHTRAAITLFTYQDTCVIVYNADGIEFVTKHMPITKDDIVKAMVDIKRVLELKKGVEE